MCADRAEGERRIVLAALLAIDNWFMVLIKSSISIESTVTLIWFQPRHRQSVHCAATLAVAFVRRATGVHAAINTPHRNQLCSHLLRRADLLPLIQLLHVLRIT
jgi:hypothetical protein